MEHGSGVSRVFRYSNDYIYCTISLHTPGARLLLRLEGLSLPLPVIDVLHDQLGRRLGGILAADTLNEVIVGVYDKQLAH